jgi:hypothetical protein
MTNTKKKYVVAWVATPPRNGRNRAYATLSNAVRAVILAWNGDEVAVLEHPTVIGRWNLTIRGRRIAVVDDWTGEAQQ